MIKTYVVKLSSMIDIDAFILRVFKIMKWLKKRYDIPGDNVDLSYGFIGDEKKDNKITIQLTFRK